MTRTERDRPAALAASEASQARVKRENALGEIAQELLDALKYAREDLLSFYEDGQFSGIYHEDATDYEVIKTIDAVIRKAEGDMQ